MEYQVGDIVTGRVKSIVKFGAFVQLADGKSGLVHISEVANAFVTDISQYLTVGQEVRMKVIGVDAAGRVSLSIRKLEAAEKAAKKTDAPKTEPEMGAPARQDRPSASFEEKLKAFLSESDSKIAGIRQYSEHRTRSRRR